MKSGFRETLDKILRQFGMLTSSVHGTVWAVGDSMWKILTAMGFKVENGIKEPNYDYIILSEKMSDAERILISLTKVDYGCIIIFRADKLQNISLWNSFKLLGDFYVFEYNPNKLLGVIVKGKR
jgi:hypothetical protein